jgi:hypothetical protein
LIIIGGHVLAFHGAHRFTGDIDVIRKSDQANARRIINALTDFGSTVDNCSQSKYQKSVISNVFKTGKVS